MSSSFGEQHALGIEMQLILTDTGNNSQRSVQALLSGDYWIKNKDPLSLTHQHLK